MSETMLTCLVALAGFWVMSQPVGAQSPQDSVIAQKLLDEAVNLLGNVPFDARQPTEDTPSGVGSTFDGAVTTAALAMHRLRGADSMKTLLSSLEASQVTRTDLISRLYLEGDVDVMLDVASSLREPATRLQALPLAVFLGQDPVGDARLFEAIRATRPKWLQAPWLADAAADRIGKPLEAVALFEESLDALAQAPDTAHTARREVAGAAIRYGAYPIALKALGEPDAEDVRTFLRLATESRIAHVPLTRELITKLEQSIAAMPDDDGRRYSEGRFQALRADEEHSAIDAQAINDPVEIAGWVTAELRLALSRQDTSAIRALVPKMAQTDPLWVNRAVGWALMLGRLGDDSFGTQAPQASCAQLALLDAAYSALDRAAVPAVVDSLRSELFALELMEQVPHERLVQRLSDFETVHWRDLASIRLAESSQWHDAEAKLALSERVHADSARAAIQQVIVGDLDRANRQSEAVALASRISFADLSPQRGRLLSVALYQLGETQRARLALEGVRPSSSSTWQEFQVALWMARYDLQTILMFDSLDAAIAWVETMTDSVVRANAYATLALILSEGGVSPDPAGHGAAGKT